MTEPTDEEAILKLKDPEYFIEVFLERALTPKQKEFLQVMQKKNHVIAMWSRQTGKSTLLASYIVHRLLFGKGKDVHGEHIAECIIVFAPIEKQLTNLFTKIRQLIDKSDLIYNYVVKCNSVEIITKNDNKCIFLSASPGSHIRGPTATCIVIDETQDVTDDKYYGDIMPMGSTTDALIIECGTPKTKNHFYNAMQSKDVAVVKQMWYECPFLSKEYITEQKSKSPEALFRQEYLCEFIEEGVIAFPSSLFIGERECNLKEYKYLTSTKELILLRGEIAESLKNGASFAMGQDLGRNQDNTILEVYQTDIRPVKLVCKIKFPLGTNYIDVARETALVYRIYSPIEFNLDYSNEKSYVDMLVTEGVGIMIDPEQKRGAIVFTQKSKSAMVNNARMLLEKKELCLPSQDTEFVSQWMNQQYEYDDKTGKYSFYHPSNEYDDQLWAALLALKNVQIYGIETKSVVEANPWAQYNEKVHNKTEKEVFTARTNLERRENFMNSDMRRGNSFRI